MAGGVTVTRCGRLSGQLIRIFIRMRTEVNEAPESVSRIGMYSEYIVGTTKLAPHPCHWVPGVVAWSWVVFFYFAHMVPQYFCGGIPRERIKGEVWYLYDIGNWSTCRMVQGSVATLNYLRLGAARGGVCTPHNCTTRSTWKSEPSALSSCQRMKIRITGHFIHRSV